MIYVFSGLSEILSNMSWNPPMEVHYQNHSTPYNSIGSFVDFFGGLTYEHVNYIFADANYVQVIIKIFVGFFRDSFHLRFSSFFI